MKKTNLLFFGWDGMRKAVLMSTCAFVFLFVGIQLNAQTIPPLVDSQLAMERVEAVLEADAPHAQAYVDESGLTPTQFKELQVKYTLYKMVYRDLSQGVATSEAVTKNWLKGQPGSALAVPAPELSTDPDVLSLGSTQANDAMMNELVDLLKL